jgi:hypothetical protein
VLYIIERIFTEYTHIIYIIFWYSDMNVLMQRPRVKEFLEALYNSLQDDGILVARAGLKDTIRLPSHVLDETKNWSKLTETFDELHADLVTDYQTPAIIDSSDEEASNMLYYDFSVVMKTDEPFEVRWEDYWTWRFEQQLI